MPAFLNFLNLNPPETEQDLTLAFHKIFYKNFHCGSYLLNVQLDLWVINRGFFHGILLFSCSLPQKGRIISLNLSNSSNALLNAVLEAAGHLCHWNTLLIHIQFVDRDSQVLLCKGAFHPFGANIYWCLGLFLPRCRACISFC